MEKILINGTALWYDAEEDRKMREFMNQREKEYANYIFSGQRTLDLFGPEEAKEVLRRQSIRDKRLCYNHKSKGNKNG